MRSAGHLYHRCCAAGLWSSAECSWRLVSWTSAREGQQSLHATPSLQNRVVESPALLGAALALEHTGDPLSEQNKPPGGHDCCLRRSPVLYLLPW